MQHQSLNLIIKSGCLDDQRVLALIEEHLSEMHQFSPPESVHALSAEALSASGLTFWSAWDDDQLAGIAALKEIDPSHGELKSMRTAKAYLRRGVAQALLDHLLVIAKSRRYARVSLETGSMDAFQPARKLYERNLFKYTGPFADYNLDQHSVFMTLELESEL